MRMNTLILNVDALTDEGRRLIMNYAERWQVPPGEATARILEELAKKKPRKRAQPTTEATA